MVLYRKDDQRPWTVVHAYSTVQEMNDDRTDWKADDPINRRVTVKSVVF